MISSSKHGTVFIFCLFVIFPHIILFLRKDTYICGISEAGAQMVVGQAKKNTLLTLLNLPIVRR